MVDNPSQRPDGVAAAAFVAQTGRHVDRPHRGFVRAGEDQVRPTTGSRFVLPETDSASGPRVFKVSPIAGEAGTEPEPLTLKADAGDSALPSNPGGVPAGPQDESARRTDEGGAADVVSRPRAGGDQLGAPHEVVDLSSSGSGDAGKDDKANEADIFRELKEEAIAREQRANPSAVPSAEFRDSLPDRLRSPQRVELILAAEENAATIYMDEPGPTLPSPLEQV